MILMKWVTLDMRKVPLGTIVTFKGGGTPSRIKEEFWNGGIPWATVKDLNSGFTLNSTQENISELGLRESASNIIPSGTLIIPTRMSLGKAVISNIAVAINQDLKAVIPANENVSAWYLLWFFVANSKEIEKMGKGATVKGITLDQLKELQIPLPPLEVQKKIAAVLEKADTLRRKREEQIKRLDDLLQATFLDMFGDPVTNPKKICKRQIGQILKVDTGGTPSRERKDFYENGNICWVKTTEVNGDKISETQEKITQKAMQSSNCKIFPVETVLIAMYGQGKTRGQVGILGIEATTNQACAAILPNHSNVNMVFLFHQLKLLYEKLRELGRGGNQPNLNLSIIKNFEILCPNLEDQKAFENFAIKIAQQRCKLIELTKKINILFKSLMQRAFKGELELK